MENSDIFRIRCVNSIIPLVPLLYRGTRTCAVFARGEYSCTVYKPLNLFMHNFHVAGFKAENVMWTVTFLHSRNLIHADFDKYSLLSGNMVSIKESEITLRTVRQSVAQIYIHDVIR